MAENHTKPTRLPSGIGFTPETQHYRAEYGHEQLVETPTKPPLLQHATWPGVTRDNKQTNCCRKLFPDKNTDINVGRNKSRNGSPRKARWTTCGHMDNGPRIESTRDSDGKVSSNLGHDQVDQAFASNGYLNNLYDKEEETWALPVCNTKQLEQGVRFVTNDGSSATEDTSLDQAPSLELNIEPQTAASNELTLTYTQNACTWTHEKCMDPEESDEYSTEMDTIIAIHPKCLGTTPLGSRDYVDMPISNQPSQASWSMFGQLVRKRHFPLASKYDFHAASLYVCTLCVFKGWAPTANVGYQLMY